MSRVGALILFMLIFNLVLNFSVALGIFTTKIPNTFYTVSDAETDFHQDKLAELNLISVGLYGIELLLEGLSMFITAIANTTVGSYALYTSLFNMVIEEGAGDSIAAILFVVQNAVVVYGVIEFASNRSTGT